MRFEKVLAGGLCVALAGLSFVVEDRVAALLHKVGDGRDLAGPHARRAVAHPHRRLRLVVLHDEA
eukprot:3039363-Pleurochrysis_carterae.AAC.1